jgi:hypothetical protein
MINNGSEPLKQDNQDNPEDNWKIVASTKNNIEAQIMVSILDSENIPHVEKTSQVASLIKVLAGFPVGEMNILVPIDRYDEALELLSNRVELQDDYDISGDN